MGVEMRASDDEIKGPGHIAFVALAVTGSFQFGYSLSVMNTAKAYIVKAKIFDESTLYGAIITSVIFLGAMIGCLLSARLAAMGRRRAIAISHMVYVVGSIFSALTHSFVVLAAARFIVGIGVGLTTVCAPMYISEMTTKETRGFYGTMHQLFITIGIMVGVMIGMGLGKIGTEITNFQNLYWRGMLLSPVFVALLSVVMMMIAKYETPHYYMTRGEFESAEEVLRLIYRRNDVSEEFEVIEKATHEDGQRSDTISVFKAIMNPYYTKVIIIGCILSAFGQLTGINIFMSNSNAFYSAFKLDMTHSTYISTGLTAFNVLMTIPAVLIVDKVGRKSLLLAGCIVQGVALLPLVILLIFFGVDTSGVQAITIFSTFGFVAGFAVAYGPVLWLYLHEIFPSEIKEGATSLASALNWFVSFVVVLPSDYLLKKPIYLIIYIAVACVIAAVFVALFMKETKMLSIDESPYFPKKVLATELEVGVVDATVIGAH